MNIEKVLHVYRTLHERVVKVYDSYGKMIDFMLEEKLYEKYDKENKLIRHNTKIGPWDSPAGLSYKR